MWNRSGEELEHCQPLFLMRECVFVSLQLWTTPQIQLFRLAGTLRALSPVGVENPSSFLSLLGSTSLKPCTNDYRNKPKDHVPAAPVAHLLQIAPNSPL